MKLALLGEPPEGAFCGPPVAAHARCGGIVATFATCKITPPVYELRLSLIPFASGPADGHACATRRVGLQAQPHAWRQPPHGAPAPHRGCTPGLQCRQRAGGHRERAILRHLPRQLLHRRHSDWRACPPRQRQREVSDQYHPSPDQEPPAFRHVSLPAIHAEDDLERLRGVAPDARSELQSRRRLGPPHCLPQQVHRSRPLHVGA